MTSALYTPHGTPKLIKAGGAYLRCCRPDQKLRWGPDEHGRPYTICPKCGKRYGQKFYVAPPWLPNSEWLAGICTDPL